MLWTEKNASELWHLLACKAVCVALCPLLSKDSDLKQYWMPDSQCKECYDCNEKFTTFRRRHHCRLCGQIFCSRCCNQEIPGKFMGYTGEKLKVVKNTCFVPFPSRPVSKYVCRSMALLIEASLTKRSVLCPVHSIAQCMRLYWSGAWMTHFILRKLLD